MAMLTRRVWMGTLAMLAGCKGNGRRVIGVIPKAVGDLFFAAVHAGVRRAAAEAGVEIVWNGPKEETDHGRQIQIVDSMVARGVARERIVVAVRHPHRQRCRECLTRRR